MPSALEFISQIYAREGKHAELVDVLDARARGASSAEARDQLALQAAQLVQTELSDVVGAVGRYRAILDRSPNQEKARAALWELARHEDQRATAIAALEPVLRAGQEWRALVELLELRLLGEDEPAQRMATLAEIARVQEQDVHDVAAAFATWARALAENAGDVSVRDGFGTFGGRPWCAGRIGQHLRGAPERQLRHRGATLAGRAHGRTI